MEECSICKENYDESTKYTIPECNHVFHTECIVSWFRGSNRSDCPLCRDNGYGYQRHTSRKYILKTIKTQAIQKKLQPEERKLVQRLAKHETELKKMQDEFKLLSDEEEMKEYTSLTKSVKFYYINHYGRTWRRVAIKELIDKIPTLKKIDKINKTSAKRLKKLRQLPRKISGKKLTIQRLEEKIIDTHRVEPIFLVKRVEI